MGVQQLVYDVAEALRHALAHKAARVFRGHKAAHVNQPVQRLAVPRAHVALQRLQLRQLALGVIDEGGEFRALALGHPGAQHPVHLFADDARRAGQNMPERLGLAVHVAHEMLGGLGQLEDGVQVDNLFRGRGHGGVIFRKALQKFPLVALRQGPRLLFCACAAAEVRRVHDRFSARRAAPRAPVCLQVYYIISQKNMVY